MRHRADDIGDQTLSEIRAARRADGALPAWAGKALFGIVTALIGAAAMGGGGALLRHAETGGVSPAELVASSAGLAQARDEIAVLRRHVESTDDTQAKLATALNAVLAGQSELTGTTKALVSQVEALNRRLDDVTRRGIGR